MRSSRVGSLRRGHAMPPEYAETFLAVRSGAEQAGSEVRPRSLDDLRSDFPVADRDSSRFTVLSVILGCLHGAVTTMSPLHFAHRWLLPLEIGFRGSRHHSRALRLGSGSEIERDTLYYLTLMFSPSKTRL